ncbi:GH25 family lysozyme [Pectinatus frisingensis]|uniref:GH25 family lysozyme n=1 Tax=Pectinatus frisingensis TaxID=865 RepID=UPI0018C481C9|nr:GH25 family lysozyme [Pectinatus frisingensis]
MKVFDISDAQPDGRVQDLVAQGAEGIILKLGETLSGVPTMDDKFVQFVNEIVVAKLPYGIYYVSHAQDMAQFMEEANFINDKVAELLNGQEPELGTWWDMEVPAVQRADVWTQLRDAIGSMQGWWNKSNKIGIYGQYSYFNNYIDLQELASYQIPVWVAQYKYSENSLKVEHPELNHTAWQFTTHDETQDENEWYGF